MTICERLPANCSSIVEPATLSSTAHEYEVELSILSRKANTLGAMKWMVGEISGLSWKRVGLVASAVALMSAIGALIGCAVILVSHFFMGVLLDRIGYGFFPFQSGLEVAALCLLILVFGAAGVILANRSPTRSEYVLELDTDLNSYDPLDIQGHQELLAKVDELGTVPARYFRRWYKREMSLIRAEMKRLSDSAAATKGCRGKGFTQA